MPKEIRHTTCPLDCPDACALEVTVEGRQVTKIGGRTDHPDTAGFICAKVAGFHRRLDHPERLLHPMRRNGAKGQGRFRRISWDEAIEEIRDRFGEIRERWGGEAILPFHYGGSNGKLTDGLTDALFFSRLGASRLDKTICAVPTTLVASAMYGKMPGVAFSDFERARFILIWGANPKSSNIHLVPALRRARAQGAFVAVVDPRRNFSRGEIDLHLAVRPGTDLPVALALAGEWERGGRLDREGLSEHSTGLETLLEAARRWPLERAAEVAGVEAGDLERLAAAYAGTSPAVVRCGWGLERNRNGARAVAAVLALPALLGKFGVRGGGYTLSNNGDFGFDREALIGETDGSRRSLNMTRLGSLLTGDLRPPIKGLFVYNANPTATVPNQALVLEGLSREDLYTVVFDQVMTDTARCADLLLPAVTFLEGSDLRAGYGSYVLGGVRPVLDPRGEARSNHQVFAALGRAMGWREGAFGWSGEELFQRAVEACQMGKAPAPREVLEAGGVVGYDFPGPAPVQLESVFPRTADGRIALAPEMLGEDPFRYEEAPQGYPLALVTPASSRLVNSTLGESYPGLLEVEMHPQDAGARGVAAGTWARVFNDLGEVVCVARVSERVRPGVVSMPKGVWRRSSLNGFTATALCPDHVQEVGGAACFSDARVEVEPA